MNQKQNIIIGAVAVVVVIVAAIFLFKGGVGGPSPEGTQTPQGTVVATGTSPISAGGKVVTPAGEPVKLDVAPGSVEAPQQSNPVSAKDIPPSVIKLTVAASGFSPSSFTVKAGEAVTVSVTSADTQTHVFMMDDPSLSAIAIGIGPGETRLITFNAPKAGEYAFHCDVPGHKDRGETGTMVVR